MKFNDIYKDNQPKSDEYDTPAEAVSPILKYIPDNVKTIWTPCDEAKSEYVKQLTAAGYKVIFTHLKFGQDFLTYQPDFDFDFIVTNPPFSIKNKVLKRCYDFKKPFALLLPITAAEGVARGKLFRTNGIGLVVLDKRISFIKDKSCWFNVSYYIHTPETDGKIIFEKLEA